jgi:hypothetical protein
MKTLKLLKIIIIVLVAGSISHGQLRAQDLKNNPFLDEEVKQFLATHSLQWHDLSISAADGQFLYDLIIKRNYKIAMIL